MSILDNKFVKLAITYLFLVLSSFGLHLYFISSGLDFNENCCDSVKQVSHFYPFLQKEFLDGNFFWSWSHGLGGDLLGGFSYYYSTSPFFWLMLPFFAIETLQDAFDARLFISVIKLFMAMAFMFHFLRFHKLLVTPAMAGSLIYGGSVFFMFYSLRYDFMIDGMIYLPMLLLAFEYALSKKRPWIFIATVFLVVTGNFYLAFINSIFLGLYAILRYTLMDHTSIKGFFLFMLHFMKNYIIGLLLAAFAFLPAVYAFINVDRFYYEEVIPLLFDIEFYKNLLYNVFFMADEPASIVMTFPGLVLLLVPLGLLLTDKKNRKRFLFVMLFSILLLIPFSYSFFNGLSAMQSRWLYLLIFSFAWISAIVLDELMKGKLKQHLGKLLTGLLAIVGLALVIKERMIKVEFSDRDLTLTIYIVIFAILLYLLHRMSAGLKKMLVSSLLVLVLAINAVYINTEMLNDFLGEPEILKDQQEKILSSYGTQEEIDLIENIQQQDDDFYRIMWNYLREQNGPMLLGYNGFSSYTSLIAGNVHQFMKQDYNVLHWNSPSLFQNLDNRLYLETALANKYYVKPKETIFKPYGFTEMFTTENFEVHQNDYALPVGYLLDEIVTEEVFETLNFAQRDQLLLNAVVVPENADIDLPEFDVEKLTVEERTLTLDDVTMGNISIDENGILHAREEAKINFINSWVGQPGELMLEVKIRNTSNAPYKVAWMYKIFTNNGEGSVYNYPREQITINIGNQEDYENLSFTLSPGSYELEEILLTFNPYSSYPEMVNNAKQQSMENITYTGRSIEGTVEAENDSILFLSVPYSSGWKAKVDGETTEALEVNSTFIGIPVTAGEHQVEIVYTTPYFNIGLMISIAALLGAIAASVWRRKRSPRESSTTE